MKDGLNLAGVVLIGGIQAVRQQIRVGLLKAIPVSKDLKGNLCIFERMAEEARRAGVELLVTGESFLDGYAVVEKSVTRSRLRRLAQDLDTSPLLKRVCRIARRRRMWQVFGFTQAAGSKLYNAAALIDARGEMVGVYHKTHLQAQDLKFDGGARLPVFPTPWGPLGIVICADRRWPETVRALRVQGARLIVMPTYGMCHDENEWWMRTRSYENQCYVCFCHPKVALITGPRGQVVAKFASSVPGVLVEDLDLSQAKDDNHLADRRPELYQALVRPKRAQALKSRSRV